MTTQDIAKLSNKDRKALSDAFLKAAQLLDTNRGGGIRGVCRALKYACGCFIGDPWSAEREKAWTLYTKAEGILYTAMHSPEWATTAYWWGADFSAYGAWKSWSTAKRRKAREQREARIFACLLIRAAFLQEVADLTDASQAPNEVPAGWLMVTSGKIKKHDYIADLSDWASGLIGESASAGFNQGQVYRHPSRF